MKIIAALLVSIAAVASAPNGGYPLVCTFIDPMPVFSEPYVKGVPFTESQRLEYAVHMCKLDNGVCYDAIIALWGDAALTNPMPQTGVLIHEMKAQCYADGKPATITVNVKTMAVFIKHLNSTGSDTIRDRYCDTVKAVFGDKGLAVVPICTIKKTGSGRRLLSGQSYDLTAEVIVPATDAATVTKVVGADGAALATSLQTKFALNTAVNNINDGNPPTITTEVRTIDSTLDNPAGRAYMVPSAIVFVLINAVMFN